MPTLYNHGMYKTPGGTWESGESREIRLGRAPASAPTGGYWRRPYSPSAPSTSWRQNVKLKPLPGGGSEWVYEPAPGSKPPNIPWAEWVPGRGGATIGGDRYGGGRGSADLYAPIEITKSPLGAAATRNLFGELNATSGGMPDFKSILNDVRSGAADANRAYENQLKAYDLTDYEARQRASDDRSAGMIPPYADTVRGIGSRYADVNARYEDRGRGALDDVLANAIDFQETGINKLALDRVQDIASRNAAKYAINEGGGMSGAKDSFLQRNFLEQALPYILKGYEMKGDALGRYQPFYGDVASRESNRLSNFEYPAERDIYTQMQAAEMQRKRTEDTIQNLKIQVAGLGMDAAIRKMATAGQSADIIARVTGLPAQVIAEKARALGLLLAAEDQSLYRSLEYLPGTGPLASPQYFSPNIGGYPSNYPTTTPSRYGPTDGTGNTGGAPGPMGNPGTGTGTNPLWPDWLIAERIKRGEQIDANALRDRGWVPGNPLEVGPGNQIFQSDADRRMSTPLSRYG